MGPKRQDMTATVYDKKGNVLSVGKNSFEKSHPKQAFYAKKVGQPYRQYLHAEVQAIIRAMKRGDAHKIKVERYDKQGNPKLAKPCPICELAIKEAGIKIVEYTIG
jgi:deoxycytidylate deaminase